jgi:hypothetical protein
MNPVQPAQHSHTQLYIVVALLVLFAILFFTFKAGERTLPAPPAIPNTPLQLNRIILTAEQIAQKEKVMSDPILNERITLTPKQIEEKKKVMESMNKK